MGGGFTGTPPILRDPPCLKAKNRVRFLLVVGDASDIWETLYQCLELEWGASPQKRLLTPASCFQPLLKPTCGSPLSQLCLVISGCRVISTLNFICPVTELVKENTFHGERFEPNCVGGSEIKRFVVRFHGSFPCIGFPPKKMVRVWFLGISGRLEFDFRSTSQAPGAWESI